MSHCLNAGGMGRIDYETETMIVTSEVVSPTLMSGSTSPAAHGKKNGTDREALVGIIPFDTTQITSAVSVRDVSPTLTGNYGKQVDNSDTALGPNVVLQRDVVAFQSSQSGVRLSDVHATLDSNNGPRRHNGALVCMRVRRLTPMECERLQGFPDRYTAIPKAKDGPRYKALGNSMAVPVMRWIGRSIDYAMIWSTP